MKYEGTVYRPPSEARSFILQATIGCAHNGCTFCSMYKDKKFRIRSLEEIFADIDEVHGQYGDNIRKIFIADGDALVIPCADLLKMIGYLKQRFPSAKSITSYGAPKDVLNKSMEELVAVKDAGLDMVYMGLESGDDVVLEKIKKGVNAEQITEAGLKLKEAGIKTSITLISGLGGKERLEEHALKSAEAINKMKPDYLGFLTLMVEPDAPLYEEIADGSFSLLSPKEVVREMRIFLEHIDSEGTVFRANHASNYFILKGTLNRDIDSMLCQIKEAEDKHEFRDEIFRSL